MRLLQGSPRLRPRARCVCGKSRRALRHVRARFSGVPVVHARTETGQLLAPTGTIAHAEAAQDCHSNTAGEREEACALIAMQSDRMLRAKIRDLMASGLLPRVQSDGSLVDEAGRSVPGQRHVGPVDLSAACSVCEDPGPQVSYQAPLDLVLHLHVKCDTLWQDEQRAHPRP